jgi:signal transduction histidine kinase
MRLDQAMQVLRGEQAPAPLGLHLATQDAPPRAAPATGSRSWRRCRWAAGEDVRLVWSGQGKAPDVQVIEGGAVLDAGRAGVLKAQAALLTAMQWPPFELGVRQADGRWRVVGSDHSDLAAWRRQVMLALLGGASCWRRWRRGRRSGWGGRCGAWPKPARVDLQAESPLPDDGPREVQMLAAAISTGRERLRAQAQDMTHMLAAVAHDLRTPLTGLRLRAEFAPAPQAARMVADIERMDAMIEQVLDYARGELQPCRCARWIWPPCWRNACRRRCCAGSTSPSGPDTLPWHGDALLLRRAVDNLIDNAERYAGAVELHVAVVGRGAAGCDGSRARASPRPTVHACCNRSSAARLAQSRHRWDRAGLAMAANVARRHAGELQLLHREGGGLIARLLLGKLPDIGCGLQAAAIR